jgi:hypothetical protein
VQGRGVARLEPALGTGAETILDETRFAWVFSAMSGRPKITDYGDV